MAIRWAVASGNWSNTATWNGGTLPTSADDVFTNNFNVTIDQDITVITLRNTSNASPAITAGGQFIVSGSSGTRNITTTNALQGIITSGTAVGTCALIVNSTLGMTVNINAVMLGSTSTFINGNCTVNFTGNLTNTNAGALVFTTSAAGGTTNYIGNINANTQDTFQAVGGLIGYTFNLVGNVTSSTSFFRAFGIITYTQTGNITSTGGGGVLALYTNTSSAIITGNLTSNGGVCLFGGGFSSTQQLTINGNVTGSLTAHAVENLINNPLSITTINGNITNVGNRMAVVTYNLRVSPAIQQTITLANTSGGTRVFYANNLTNYPAVTDVRFGVVYSMGALTGTCYVPAAASVAYGVPVDNTTGTAVLTRAQLISDVGAIVAAYTV